jgi:TolB-like protein
MLEWRAVSLAAALVLMAVVAIVLVRRPGNVKPATSIRSLAVLPLENLTGDPSQDYFADGMTDELITALAKIHSLRVISRTSVMQYKGIRRPVRDIAHELGVDGILEGSISHSGNRVHLRVQLIHAASDTHVWADSYDRELNEAFELPVAISQTIAKEVDVAASAPAPQHYVNPEAHDAYLRGRFFWFSDDDGSSLQYFEKAIQLQPDYAAAWSGLSDYYGGRAVAGVVPPQEFKENWESDARKAITLDDSMADGHNSLAAWYFFGAWDWKRAEAESLRAIAVNPNYAEAYHVYSYILTVTNRPREAVEAQKRGMEVDPFARPWALGYTYYHLHQFDAAVNELRLREQADSKRAATHDILAQAYQAVGAEEAAVREWEQVYLLQDDKESATALRKAFERGGYKAVTKWRLEHETEGTRGRYFSPFWLALKTAEARRKEETLKLLEDAYREHSPRLVFLQSEPVFDFLHAEPRYQAIVRKVGLPVTPVK